MLNLTDIAQRISQPHLCKSEDAEDLRLLCEKYPYSQVFPLLYLSVLAHSNDVHFDQELTKHAFKISDRTRLFELISEKENGQVQEVLEVLEVQEVQEVSMEIEEKVPNQDEIIEQEIITNEEISIVPEIETIERVENQTTFNEETSDSITNIQQPTSNQDSFEDEITAQTIAASYSLEHEELKFKKNPNNRDDEKAKLSETAGINELQIKEEGKRKKEEGASSEDEKVSVSAAAGINELLIKEEGKRKKEEGASSEDEKEELENNHPTSSIQHPINEIIASSFEQSVEIESKKSFSSWLHANDNYTEIKEEKVNVDGLISKFIEDSPKISQPNEKLFEGRTEKKEFFSPTKKAKESLSEHQLPVSETLAKIFAAQGNFPKAIYAYEQLMLIIPEKKIFFANQIKELQKKLNQV